MRYPDRFKKENKENKLDQLLIFDLNKKNIIKHFKSSKKQQRHLHFTHVSHFLQTSLHLRSEFRSSRLKISRKLNFED